MSHTQNWYEDQQSISEAIADDEYLTWHEKYGDVTEQAEEVDNYNPMDDVKEMLNQYYYQLGVCTYSLKQLERELTDLYAKHTNILKEIDSCLDVLKPSK